MEHCLRHVSHSFSVFIIFDDVAVHTIFQGKIKLPIYLMFPKGHNEIDSQNIRVTFKCKQKNLSIYSYRKIYGASVKIRTPFILVR